jgi:nucleotide-binding universal stress UspA family protein
MKTIVVAVDFSKGSSNAIEHSKRLAKIMNTKLVLVHSYTPPILDLNIPIGIVEKTYHDIEKILEDKLKIETEQIKKEGIKVDYQLSFSDLSSVLNDVCYSENVAFIVVGKTGQSNFFDKLIGSMANHLIDTIHVPLLVIPENFETDILKKLCYASQLEYDEEKYIKYAIKIAKLSPNALHLGHIDKTDELNINPNEPFLKSIIAKFEKDKIQIIQRENKSLKKGINQLIVDEDISLLILTTHKRGILDGILNPSRTKQIIKDTRIPILVFSFDEK